MFLMRSPQVCLVDAEGHPAYDGFQSGFGQDVGDAVGHAQIGADGPVEDLVEDAEDIGGGPADVNADEVDVLLPGGGLHDQPDRAGSGHDGSAGPFHELSIAGCLRHDVFEKEVVDDLSRRAQRFLFEPGADVIGEGERGFTSQYLLNAFTGVFVPCVDHGELKSGPEPGPGVGGGDEFGEFDDVADRSPVGSTREEDHVGSQVADALNFLVGLAAVVGGQHIHDNGSGAQGRALCAFSGHGLDHTGDHHLEPTSGAAGGNVDIDAAVAPGGGEDTLAVQDLATREFLHFLDSVEHAPGDVLEGGFHGGRGLPPAGLAVDVSDFLDEDGLGGGAAAVGSDNDVQVIHSVRFPVPGFCRSSPRCSGVFPGTGQSARILQVKRPGLERARER